MIYCFDLDNTLCLTSGKDYTNSTPIPNMIDRVNFLYDNQHEIIIFTARGMGKFQGDVSKAYQYYFNLTESQLKKWGVKYNRLILGKPSFDHFIDDKNKKIEDFKSDINPITGFIAGSFDVIHPGYIKMFKEIKKKCDYLIVGLQENPKIERSNKMAPILTLDERSELLSSLIYVNKIIPYKTEQDLLNLLKTNKIDIRFLGDDYQNSKFTGSELPIVVEFLDRSHGWSTTKYKKLIAQSII